MKRILLATVLALLLAVVPLGAVVIDTYAWEFPVVTGTSATALVTWVQEHVATVTTLGNELAPCRVYQGDLPANEEYWLFIQPGELIESLAWAYPYLSTAQQTAVVSYVQAELGSSTHRPWATAPLSVSAGTRRELHPLEKITYMTSTFGTGAQLKPSVQTIYGLWLYAYRTGDWTTISTHLSSIRTMYTNRAAQGNVYGTYSAHIGMARIEEHFNNTTEMNTALSNLQTQMDAGVTFATVEGNVDNYYPEFYDTGSSPANRRHDGTYPGWMFKHLTPEVARYLDEQVASATTTRHAELTTDVEQWHNGVGLFDMWMPQWWLRKANYFTRLTGDESVGGTSETLSMAFNIERFVLGTASATLQSYVRSGPICHGDVYWLMAAVGAIESTGSLTWTDVRD